MNNERLLEIIRDATVQFRKGEALAGDPKLVNAIKNNDPRDPLPSGTVSLYMMEHQSKAPDNLEKVDVHFIVIGVDKAKAEQYKAELIQILKSYDGQPPLSEGLSYMHVGGEIGDQGTALQLFALGKVLGLWNIITPESLGITGAMANDLAGSGMVMTDGFRPSGDSVGAVSAG